MAKIKITSFVLILLMILHLSCSERKTPNDVFSEYPPIVIKNNLQTYYDSAKLKVYLYHYDDICIEAWYHYDNPNFETEYRKGFLSNKPLGLVPLTLDTLEIRNDTILFHFHFIQDSLMCNRAISKRNPDGSTLVIFIVALSMSSNNLLYVEKTTSSIIWDKHIDFAACLRDAIADTQKDSTIVNSWLLKEIRKHAAHSP